MVYNIALNFLLATLAVRLLLCPVIIKSNKNMIKLNHNQPEMQKLQHAAHVAKTKQEGKLLICSPRILFIHWLFNTINDQHLRYMIAHFVTSCGCQSFSGSKNVL